MNVGPAGAGAAETAIAERTNGRRRVASMAKKRDRQWANAWTKGLRKDQRRDKKI